MTILRTYGRLWVDDMERALPLLTELVGAEPHLRFAFADVELAAIGDFLVLAVPEESRAAYPATVTVVVDDLDAVRRRVVEHGGEITVPEATSETGRFLYARHADGAEVEYVQWRPELVERLVPGAGSGAAEG